jgi:hypothetical protein
LLVDDAPPRRSGYYKGITTGYIQAPQRWGGTATGFIYTGRAMNFQG